MRIEKHLARAISTGGSFEGEMRDVLAARCKLAYGSAFVVSVLSYLFYQQVVNKAADIVSTPFEVWHELVYYAYPLVFGLALVALIARRWSARQTLLIDHAVMSIAILVSLFTAAVFLPAEPPILALSLILFVHAAIIPVPTAHQLGLAALATLGYPLGMLAAHAWVPGIAEFWTGEGGAAYRETVLEGTFSIGVIAAISVLVTQALYGLRKSLHQAQRLGNYVIEREIGRGGMGRVYVAQHALMCRPTAIKTLEPPAVDGGPLDSARFEREVRLSATLTHPNTITIYDFGRSSDDTFYYAMEYLEGLDLQDMVEHFGPLPAERAIYVLRQVCGPLVEAHARNIIHRDIKPSNIFLTHRGGLFDFVKVLDFGLAKQFKVDDAPSLTKDGQLFGTPRYMAPEMVYGNDGIDNRSDIYGLGGVMYWMVTGNPPFTARSSVEVLVDQVKTTPRRPSEVSELPIPTELEDIIMKCLEKKPADRFQTALELQLALESVPLERPWNEDRACSWWSLHAPEDVRVSECVRRAAEGSRLVDAGDEPALPGDLTGAVAAG